MHRRVGNILKSYAHNQSLNLWYSIYNICMQENGRGNQYQVQLKYNIEPHMPISNIVIILTCDDVTTVIPKSFASL